LGLRDKQRRFPVFVELIELVGTVRLRFQMMPEAPFMKDVTFTHQTSLEYQDRRPVAYAYCVPLTRHSGQLGLRDKLIELVGTVRLRFQMMPEAPFMKDVTFTLVGIPHVKQASNTKIEDQLHMHIACL
jgi:Ca2+-dependent lipid-binding protein